MTAVNCAFMPRDIFSIVQVQDIATQEQERAVLIFGGSEGKVSVLCGQSCSDTWAIIPPVNKIIEWVSETKTYFREAIVVHNHPHLPWHGEIIPSDDDIAATEFLKWQLALLGITLHDHIIISGNKKRSLLEMNLYHNGPLKTSGFEIKRFLYCFLVQVSLVLEHHPVVDTIINLLEKNLDMIRNYYEKPWYLRVFTPKPDDGGFKSELAGLKTSDNLLSRLVDALIQLEGDRNFKIQPEKVIPYGIELWKRIIK
ncbi:JAB domain-containing protein [Desulfoscipio geothermicus]|uniref:DNA repair protein RadC n=1 Tax=Desulfoscipio geothermicus DSM 3669 TaxID=1121426 RepID=A0A1I6D2I0_9FIRM|nr:JAB domain-containing protein [Desulfoscipio geothermicus]SFQ99552.1 DNA repair protein RadC [Desulfoscipio geothermicus DSM 3669]